MVNLQNGRQNFNLYLLLIAVCCRVIHELPSLYTAKDESCDWDDLEKELPVEAVAQVLENLLAKRITGQTAKNLIAIKFRGDKRDIRVMIEEGGLTLRQMSREDYVAMARALIDANQGMAQKVRKGQSGKLMWFVGQMMKEGKGSIEAEKAKFVLEEILSGSEEET